MQGRRSFVLLVAAGACALATTVGAIRAVAQARDPFSGTWALNVAKSSFKPGPPLKNGLLTVEYTGKMRKSVFENVAAAGDRARSEYTAPEDGNDYPLRGSANADTVALRRTNAFTIERIDKRRGQVTLVYSIRVSVDGKTLTVTQKGVTVAGDMVMNTLVFDRR
jgi:hypothetical protein